mgnify:CR=1 FL=1
MVSKDSAANALTISKKTKGNIFKPIGSNFYENFGELKKLFEETNKYKISNLDNFYDWFDSCRKI